jgi:NAD(P)-dependent dehydrogenase (short-subunit alcohol dehydrogenase family)
LLKAKEAESIPAERQIGSGAANIPLGRMAQPEEIAAAMLFLASEEQLRRRQRLLVDGCSAPSELDRAVASDPLNSAGEPLSRQAQAAIQTPPTKQASWPAWIFQSTAT